MKRIVRRLILTAGLTAAFAVSVASSRAAEVPHPVVNINTATETELMYLPHVGPTTAAWIHAYAIDRSSPGRAWQYTSVDQLLNVTNAPGGKGRHLISKRALDDMRPYLTLTGPTTATAKIRTPKRK